MKKLSCGGLIFAPDGTMLIVRPRWDSRLWSIPKGEPQSGEDVRHCAEREIEEETSITPDMYLEVKDLGHHTYIPSKDVHLFEITLKSKPDKLKCQSFFTEDSKCTPEVVDFEWASQDRVFEKTSKAIQELIQRARTKV